MASASGRIQHFTTMNVVAWDPGASGSFAWESGGKLFTRKFPDDLENLSKLLYSILSNPLSVLVYESQTGFAGTRNSAPAMFSFGCSYQSPLSAIAMLNVIRAHNRIPDIDFMAFTPVEWQSMLGIDDRKQKKEQKISKKKWDGPIDDYDSYCRAVDARNQPLKRAWKTALYDRAVEIYRGRNLAQPITMSNCDALLLLECGQLAIRLRLF